MNARVNLMLKGGLLRRRQEHHQQQKQEHATPTVPTVIEITETTTTPAGGVAKKKPPPTPSLAVVELPKDSILVFDDVEWNRLATSTLSALTSSHFRNVVVVPEAVMHLNEMAMKQAYAVMNRSDTSVRGGGLRDTVEAERVWQLQRSLRDSTTRMDFAMNECRLIPQGCAVDPASIPFSAHRVRGVLFQRRGELRDVTLLAKYGPSQARAVDMFRGDASMSVRMEILYCATFFARLGAPLLSQPVSSQSRRPVMLITGSNAVQSIARAEMESVGLSRVGTFRELFVVDAATNSRVLAEGRKRGREEEEHDEGNDWFVEDVEGIAEYRVRMMTTKTEHEAHDDGHDDDGIAEGVGLQERNNTGVSEEGRQSTIEEAPCHKPIVEDRKYEAASVFADHDHEDEDGGGDDVDNSALPNYEDLF